MKLIRLWMPLMACLLLAIVVSGSTRAQVATATMLGVVKDSTGGVLPGVSVTAKNIETGIARTAITDDGGRYRIPELSVGAYEIQAELSGFQTTVRRGITLTIGQEALIDLTLNVGEMTERVEVLGEAPQVETTSSTIAGLVDEKKVRDLPLNARSLIELAPLKSGVTFAEYGDQHGVVGFSRKISIAGTRQNTSLFQLDGANITDRAGAPGSAAGLLMGVETIREFNIVTNAYSAEYGRHVGGVFNAVTKSGTNEWHGSVFEFLRNDNLDARNFFDRDPKNPTVRSNPPEFKRNQYGFALGGPVVQNQTFIFGSYEGLRERLGVTQFFNVLSNDARRGFLRNPATGQLREVGIAPNVKPFVNLFPAPNSTDFGDGRAEYIRGITQSTDEDFVTIRFDHNFSENDSFFARYTYDDGIKSVPSNLNAFAVADSRNQFFTLGETRVFSPQLINKFTFGFNRSNLSQYNDTIGGAKLRSFTPFTQVGSLPLYGTLSIGGGVSNPLGSNFTTAFEINNYFQYKDDLYYTKGKHSMKFGADVERRQDNRTQGVFQRGGDFSFFNIEDFLVSKVDSFSGVIAGDAQRYLRQWQFGFYFQDDMKLTPNFTLNLGVRWEFVSDLVDRHGQVSTFRFDWRNVLGITDSMASLGNPLFKNPSRENVAPRIGFAWDPWGDTKTAIRAGFGVFFDPLNSKYSSGGDSSIEPLISRRFQLFANRLPVPIDFPEAVTTQRALLVATPQADVTQWEPNQPYLLKWSLDIQREIGAGTVITAGYTGNRGVHLSMITTWNVAIAQLQNGRLFVPTTAPVRHPQFGRFRPMQFLASSTYHDFRLELNRRFFNSLQFQVSYTWGKSIDDTSSTVGSGDFSNDGAGSGQRYLDMRDTGLSAFDVRHNLVFNFTYELPGRNMTGLAGKVLGGWSLSGIGRFSDGQPFNVSSGAQARHMRFIRDYPDLKPGSGEVRIDERNPNRYFDPTPFNHTNVPGGALVGNFGRNVLIAPGIANFDLVLTNNIKASERLDVQFRAEFFNLFNRANFAFPSGAIFDPRTLQIQQTVGRITRTITTSRQIQFGLKFLF
ncbi:MAG: TonB-dependent receptor [Acidobacteria bacterium]|nr:TonB-dependent receptor [Acidobacteriota bacterium]